MPHNQFNELHIVSDLHFGGKEGHRIFAQTEVFSKWIRGLAARSSERKIALVFNGDIVDFLADENAVHFDTEHPIDKLNVALGAFEPILEALKMFVESPLCWLYLLVGNHDVELALPHVADHIVACIRAGKVLPVGSQPPSAPDSRICCKFGGDGCEFHVGDRRVRCVHGNQHDDWNRVDYARVQTIGQELRTWGKATSKLRPNAGTKLVVEALNEVKTYLPFVDLLKPEGIRLLAVLVALQPALAVKLSSLIDPAEVLVREKMRTAGSRIAMKFWNWGLLSALDSTSNPGSLLQDSPNEVIERAEAAFRDGVRPTDLAGPPGSIDTLGFFDWMKAIVGRGLNREEALRRALHDWMGDDRSFDIHTEDDVFRGLDAEVPQEVDFIVAGHTHLMRALRRSRGRGVYFNSGTWIRLLRLKQHNLASPEAFRPVYEALTMGMLDALDEFDLKRRTVVVIAECEGTPQVKGALYHVEEDGTLTVVPDSELWPLEGERL